MKPPNWEFVRHKVEKFLDAVDAKDPEITEVTLRIQGRDLQGVDITRHLSRP